VSHVGIVVFENQSYESVLGSAAMPYLNSLIAQNAVATNYYANAHPSLPNYFMLTVGDVVTNTNDFTGKVTTDNVVRRLLAAGKTWKGYMESLPSVGYTGGDSGPYVRRHNPFAYLSDVVDDAVQVKNIVPFTQLGADMAGQLPNYFFITPDNTHNAHDCPNGMTTCTTEDKLAAADQWLKANLAPLMASPAFQASGLLVITFDESVMADTANGGGHVATVLVGSGVKPGFRSTNYYQHQSVLRLMLQVLGITNYPGAAANAAEMREFFP
jgi:acid phosphatase